MSKKYSFLFIWLLDFQLLFAVGDEEEKYSPLLSVGSKLCLAARERCVRSTGQATEPWVGRGPSSFLSVHPTWDEQQQ